MCCCYCCCFFPLLGSKQFVHGKKGKRGKKVFYTIMHVDNKKKTLISNSMDMKSEQNKNREIKRQAELFFSFFFISFLSSSRLGFRVLLGHIRLTQKEKKVRSRRGYTGMEYSLHRSNIISASSTSRAISSTKSETPSNHIAGCGGNSCA